MAGLNATKLLEVNPEAASSDGPSIYESRGVLVL